ncbi:MAG: hypothetical protein COW85_11865 [Ignavibacteria bacterium CG22_combo_CG10-13_8_21_14_all_37_15]|nr:MAG: hypothetical protein COW85_11865 [Ignavibacteria bacterium CG22_combo_CG10-13_8_21_14_all_37_15]
MLANHYFLVRDYERAAIAYEAVIDKTSRSKAIRKKIIICYVKTFQMEKALTEFCKLVEEDIHFIINSDLKADDCPYKEIITEIENDEIYFGGDEKNLVLGILWLYCDLQSALKYFDSYFRSNSNNPDLERAYQIIQTYNQPIN